MNNIPHEEQLKIDNDILVYGNGYYERDEDGNCKHVPFNEVMKQIRDDNNE